MCTTVINVLTAGFADFDDSSGLAAKDGNIKQREGEGEWGHSLWWL